MPGVTSFADFQLFECNGSLGLACFVAVGLPCWSEPWVACYYFAVNGCVEGRGVGNMSVQKPFSQSKKPSSRSFHETAHILESLLRGRKFTYG